MPLRRLHNLGQNPAHVLGMDEENQRAVRADAGGAEDALAERLELGAGLGDGFVAARGAFAGGQRGR